MTSFLIMATLALLTLQLGPQSAHAALGITPPQLVPDSSGVVVTEVQSSMTSRSRWSARVVGWGPAGEEVLGVAGDVSPRFFSLEPGGRQLVRARLRDRSKYYRLLIEQVPETDKEIAGLAFRFRFSLPVYQSPQEPIAVSPTLAFTGSQCADFNNTQSRVVRVVLSPEVTGPQTLLPGESARFCRNVAPMQAEADSPLQLSADQPRP